MAHFEQQRNNDTQRQQQQELAYHTSTPEQYTSNSGQQNVQYATENQYYSTRNGGGQRHTPPGHLNTGFSYPRSPNPEHTPTTATAAPSSQSQQQQHSQYPAASSSSQQHRYSSSYPLESASQRHPSSSSSRAHYQNHHQQSASVELPHRKDTGYSQESTYDNNSNNGLTPLPRPVTADSQHAYPYNRPVYIGHHHSASYPSSPYYSQSSLPPEETSRQHQQQQSLPQEGHQAYPTIGQPQSRLPPASSNAQYSPPQHPQYHQHPYASHSNKSSTSSIVSEPGHLQPRKQASFDQLASVPAQEPLPLPPDGNTHQYASHIPLSASSSASSYNHPSSYPPAYQHPQQAPLQHPPPPLAYQHQQQQQQPYPAPSPYPTSAPHHAHHPSDPAYYHQQANPSSLSMSAASSSSHSFAHSASPIREGVPAYETVDGLHKPPNNGILSTSASGIIHVYTCHPKSGNVATPVSLSIGVIPHQPHLIRGFRVMYGSHGTTTRVVGEQRFPDGAERVELVASTPSYQLANRHAGVPPSMAMAGAGAEMGDMNGGSRVVQLVLQALDEYGGIADSAELGYFEYEDSTSPVQPLPASLPKISQKRPGSPLSGMRDSPSSTTRPTFGTDGDPQRQHSRGSSIGSLVNGFTDMTHHSRTSSLASISDAEAGPPPGTGSSVDGNGNMWISTPDGETIERKPIARLRTNTNVPTYTISSSSLRHPPIDATSTGAPTLYRTTQISAGISEGTAAAAASASEDAASTISPPPTATAIASPHTTGSSSYASLENKASLHFESDLNLMALGWSHDEWLVKRRLVQFWRRQQGNQIIANFRPVSLQDINSSSIVISCIFREDKNECFVTSVDTIYLLEALVAVRFTVEEKNRIRRNLEGFKPITISKTKADSEPFFKLIMSFPNPKPRNIEKDVKVFPWKILGPALRKIISKYSAAYAPPDEITAPGRLVQPIGWLPGQTPSVPTTHAQSTMPRAQVLLPSAYTYRSEPSSPQSSQMAYTPTASSGTSSRVSTGNHSHSHSLSSQYSIAEEPEPFLAGPGDGTSLPADATIQEAGMLANMERDEDDTTPNQQTGPGQAAETPFSEAQRTGPPQQVQVAGY